MAFLSEERPDNGERQHKEAFWFIDPLDGALPFAEGVPGYSVSIGLVPRAGEPIIGVVYDPLTQTVFHANMRQGVWKDNQPLKPIELSKPAEQTLIFLTDKSFAQDPLYPASQSGDSDLQQFDYGKQNQLGFLQLVFIRREDTDGSH